MYIRRSLRSRFIVEASLLRFRVGILTRTAGKQGLPLTRAQTGCIIIFGTGKKVLLVECVWYVMREQLGKSVMVVRPLCVKVCCKRFLMPLSTTSMNTN